MDVRRRMSFNNQINTDNYLTIVAFSDGLTASLSNNACQYCIDGDGNWIDLPANTATQSINYGQTLSFKAELTPNGMGIGIFNITQPCHLEGNCMSMLFGDSFENNYSLYGKPYAFFRLFVGCKTITAVSDTFLPATTLDQYCYKDMFNGCSNLITAPELPATTLADSCYVNMFADCTSLFTTPELPATTLADSCYASMFNGCSNLITAPELPATTLVDYCYASMFSSCSNLNYIKMLATDISATECLSNWVYGVSSTGTFVKKTTMTSLPNGTSGIPEGWTVVNNTGPINTDNYLTILALEDGLTASLSVNACQYCVDGDGNWIDLPSGTTTQTINQGQKLSFKGILTPYLSTGIGTFTINKRCNLEGNCMSMLFAEGAMNNSSLSKKAYAFSYLFKNCTTIVEVSDTFLPATTLGTSCYNSMFYGCTSLTTAPELPATTVANGCYNSMFYGCTSLTTAPELPATTVRPSCYNSMFYGCTSLTTAPELPATSLRIMSNCYNSMFYGCSNLNYIKMLATNISGSNCLSNWVSGVSSTGTFVKNANMTELPTGDSGIPEGWTVVDDTGEAN